MEQADTSSESTGASTRLCQLYGFENDGHEAHQFYIQILKLIENLKFLEIGLNPVKN